MCLSPSIRAIVARALDEERGDEIQRLLVMAEAARHCEYDRKTEVERGADEMAELGAEAAALLGSIF